MISRAKYSSSKAAKAHLLQSLVNRHSSHGDRGVPEDPLSSLFDVLPGREVHEGVRAPQGGPLQLFHLCLDAANHVRVADVAVDLNLCNINIDRTEYTVNTVLIQCFCIRA